MLPEALRKASQVIHEEFVFPGSRVRRLGEGTGVTGKVPEISPCE